jgi:hypothetical protein
MIEQIFGNPSNFTLFLVVLVGVLIFLFVVRLFLRFLFYILLGILALTLMIGGGIYLSQNSGEGNLSEPGEVNLTQLNQLAEKGKSLLGRIDWGAVLTAVATSAAHLDQNRSSEAQKGEK